MDREEPRPKPERKFAQTRAELPLLRDGYVRVVHLTHKGAVGDLVRDGLDYSTHGMLMSTARSYGKESDVVYGSDDPRFQGPDMVAVIMDVPIDEHRLHETVGKSPGKIPPEYIVGMIPCES